MLAGGQHHAGVGMAGLVRIPVPHAAAFQYRRPQRLTDGLVTRAGPWILEDFLALEPGVLFLPLERRHG